jgi:pseudouridine synthase
MDTNNWQSAEGLRIHKYLAQAWIASRRKCEEFIERWLVSVNGEPAHIWQIVYPDKDDIVVGKEAVRETEKFVYFKMSKPRWIVTTCVSRDDTGIMDIIDIKERVFPIGRLDKDSIGLILLTNDGRLSNYLMHPRYAHEKEYLVEVYGKIEDADLVKLSSGSLSVLGERVLPAEVRRASSGAFTIVLREWKNRQIRRMLEALWYGVKKLKRIRIENIELGNLQEWEYIPLSFVEKEKLLDRTVRANSKGI